MPESVRKADHNSRYRLSPARSGREEFSTVLVSRFRCALAIRRVSVGRRALSGKFPKGLGAACSVLDSGPLRGSPSSRYYIQGRIGREGESEKRNAGLREQRASISISIAPWTRQRTPDRDHRRRHSSFCSPGRDTLPLARSRYYP